MTGRSAKTGMNVEEAGEVAQRLARAGGKPPAKSPRPTKGPVYICCGGLEHTPRCRRFTAATNVFLMLMAIGIMCLALLSLWAFIFAVLEKI